MKIDRLVVASKNPAKIAEIYEVLNNCGLEVEIAEGLGWPEVEETGATLEENAMKKAREVFEATGVASLADDTGLFVAALDGLPGVNTARFAGPSASYGENVALLLEKLDGIEERAAKFRTVVALVIGEKELSTDGELDGRISLSPRGNGGFGYDPVFELDSGQTLAELDPVLKNRLSHRGRALRALIKQLDA